MGSCNNQSSPQRRDHLYVMLDTHEPECLNPATEDQSTGDISTNSQESDLSISLTTTQESLINDEKSSQNRFSNLTLKLTSALAYGICSFLITVINKLVLTTYGFPSANILGVGQMVSTIIILRLAHLFKAVNIRTVSLRNKKLFVLAFLYLANLMTSLGGTKSLSLPMYIALRRFSIALTAILEFYILGTRQTIATILTITAMIGGSMIAATSDLSFNAFGYILVMISNFFGAYNGVYTKKTIDCNEISKQEILYYNAFLTVLPLAIISYLTNTTEEIINYKHWNDLGFILSFITSCLMGYLLMYSTVLCTHYNSALTTTIVGTLKVSFATIDLLYWRLLNIQLIIRLYNKFDIEYTHNICRHVHRWGLSFHTIEFPWLKFVTSW